MDVFKGTRSKPTLQTPIELLRSIDYLNWVGTAEYKVWSYLYSYIIRAPMVERSFGNFIYENYYLKGFLASRWNQKQMAQNMGKSRNSSSQISRLTTTMAEKRFIEKEYCGWNGQKTLIYVFGTCDNTSRKHETIFAFEELYKHNKNEKTPQEVFDSLSITP